MPNVRRAESPAWPRTPLGQRRHAGSSRAPPATWPSACPTPLAPLARAGLQLPLVLAARRARRCSARSTRALRALPREPGAPAPGGHRARPAARRRRRRPGRAARLGCCEAAVRADLERPSAVGPDRSRTIRSPSSARRVRRPRARCRSTPAASARSPATSSRRPPTARCRSSPSASCTARATSASASTRRAGSTSTGSTPIPSGCPRRSSPASTDTPLDGQRAGRRARASRRASGASTSAACPLFLLDTDWPENDALASLDHGSRLYVGDPRHAARPVRRCSASAACARCARSGSSPGSIHLNEGHAALAPLELARPQVARRGAARRRARRRPRAHGLHHPHAGAGRQRHLPGRARCEPALGRSAPRSSASHPASCSASAARTPTTCRSPFGVTQVALRMSRRRQRREPPPRRGRARDVARAVAGARAPEDVPIGHVTNGVHVPTWVGPRRCASCSTATSARTGCARARRPRDLGAASTTSPTRSCGRRARAPARRAGRLRAPPQRHRPARARTT